MSQQLTRASPGDMPASAHCEPSPDMKVDGARQAAIRRRYGFAKFEIFGSGRLRRVDRTLGGLTDHANPFADRHLRGM
jgi:hypothetical protein